MGSRLLQAIVGVGISLGTSACGGMIDEAADGAPPREDASSSADASADAVADAAPDALFLDAFCDAAWPPTKGSTSPYVCGSTTECAEAGYPPTCQQELAPADCSYARWATWCVAGQWQCATGAISRNECKCFDRDGGCP